MLLWLWLRLGAAALIQPVAWEFSNAAGAVVKRKRKRKKKKTHWLRTFVWQQGMSLKESAKGKKDLSSVGNHCLRGKPGRWDRNCPWYW